LKIYQAKGDRGRAIGYGKGISGIKAHPGAIIEPKDLDGIPGVGKAIKDKTAEWFDSGTIRKLDCLQKDGKTMALEELTGVWGVGPQTALKLYSQDIKSVKELRKYAELLTNAQQIGLKHYDDFLERMPRSEAQTISIMMQKETKKFFSPAEVVVEACGSFRRGKDNCGDVDVLITRKDDKPVAGMLNPLIEHLEKKGLLKERLSATKVTKEGSEMYMGVCKVSTKSRRIDIKVYPKDQYGYALLYFTGSAQHNIKMRNVAEQKGYTLSDHGLVKINSGQTVPCETEEEIFKFLGMDFKTPL